MLIIRLHPKQISISYTKKIQHKRVFSYMYLLVSDWIEMLFRGQCSVNLSTDHLFINLG